MATSLVINSCPQDQRNYNHRLYLNQLVTFKYCSVAIAMAMKIEKQSTKIIKPLVPTPTLRRYKLGLVDEFAPSINVGVVLFFSSNSNHDPKFIAQLEKSLEKTLTRFYPLCGRYDSKTQTIDCNDEGADFISAKVNIKLQDILVSEDVHFIDEFIPSKIGVVDDQLNASLLATQVTTFECGGLALGVSVSHRLVDASTLCTFINEWGLINRAEHETEPAGPGFISSSLFPARGLPPYPVPLMGDDMFTKFIRKKLSFSASVISNMKANYTNSTRKWSKVQLVSAIIWKALMVVDRATYNCQKESILLQPFNLRGKMASDIPKNACGNLWGYFATKATTNETTKELTDLLCDSVKKTVSELSKAYHDTEEGQMMILNCLIQLGGVDLESTNVSGITSWCKFPFYEADFGFGKPSWVAPGTLPIQNSAFFMDDSEGNGLEAYVFLEVKDVLFFEEALNSIAFAT
ncbi:pelargonidin 3-O-(6-caffeoylglucoside) 5-O-(6-O-malonylglucoside) 4'''-malonyltransferase-like [Rutidosis leptorrhynchoides]|uniref:pelargonidin 3-O-(6-caffeoylglucoside) 5-O-(6-O-malonylglucoside) 4'''-malonyltransferase-like n=1 Tax=Rutidosis leptorrhynchoides TaxID=125765 RepID=UPI003A9A11BF